MAHVPVTDPAVGLVEAERRIAACRTTRAVSLDLSGLMLTELPPAVLELSWLQSLDLGIDQEAAKWPGFWDVV